jgi:septum formation protein
MLLPNLENTKIVLASKSPRRQGLLGGLELEFEIRTLEVEEVYPPDLQREDVPRYLAKLKADAMKPTMAADELIITSDTIVYLDNEIIEKPADRSEAIEMVSRLSGNTHTVITAVALTSNKQQKVFHDETIVEFEELSQEEIEHYIDNYEPYDKAGSYGVQELIGYIGIKSITGSYFNVMGLPLHRLYQELKLWGDG